VVKNVILNEDERARAAGGPLGSRARVEVNLITEIRLDRNIFERLTEFRGSVNAEVIAS
jgi:hypothetical protein